MPDADRPSSRTMSGAAMETMVWSMNVIATANIIAVSATVCRGADRGADDVSPGREYVSHTRPVCARPGGVASPAGQPRASTCRQKASTRALNISGASWNG